MPTNAELNLILRFKDQATAAVKNAGSAIGQSFKEMGIAAEKLGRELKQVGRDLIQLGGVVTGYFTLAIRDAAKAVPEVRDVVRDMGSEFSRMQQVIAQAVVPVLQMIVSMIRQLRQAFEQMDPQTRDFIIRMVFIGGLMAVVSGTIIRMAGSVLTLAGNLVQLVGNFALAHPVMFLLSVLAIVLINNFGDWEKVILAVARAFDVAVASIRAFIDLMMTGILQLVDNFASNLEHLMDLLGHLPGKFGEPFRKAAADIKAFRAELNGIKDAAAQSAAINLDKVFVTLKQGGGTVENSMIRAKNEVKDLIATLKNLKPEVGNFTVSLGEDLKQFWTDFSDVSKKTGEIIKSGILDLESRFSSIFNKILTDGMKAKDAFAEFGKAIIGTITTMIAKFLAFIATVAVIAAVLAAFQVPPAATFKAAFKFIGAFHQGGAVNNGLPRYHDGGEVMAALQPGEFVVNKDATRKNRGLLEQINNGTAGGGGGMVFVNNWQVNATDANSFRAQMAQNDDLVEQMFQRAVKRNSGAMRQATRT